MNNQDKAKISVIVPVYNVEKFLPGCIESILNQKYENVELILVDDGSPDGSGKICDDYAQKSDKIKVIHKENAGASAARNTGILAATGEYIHFCDADDTIEPDTYSNIVPQMVKEDADVAYFGWYVDVVKGRKIDRIWQTENAMNGVGTQYDIFNTMLIVCGGYGGNVGYGNYIWNKLYKRETFKDKNGNFILFDETVKIAEDGLWLVTVGQNWNKGIFDNRPYYHYLKNEESVTNTPGKFVEVKLASQESHKKMLAILKEFNEEYYVIHRDACIDYFWHSAKGAYWDEEFIAKVISNVVEINEGKCPLNIATDCSWYMRHTHSSRRLMNRRLVKLAIKAVKKIDKTKNRATSQAEDKEIDAEENKEEK